MIIMATSTRLFLLLLLLSFLICSSAAGVSPVKDHDREELKREEEQIFHLSDRVLIATRHDLIVRSRTANPSTPVTIHMTSTTPGIVTVPSTNPGLTPNPTGNPVTVPSTTPVPTTNPVNNSTPTGGVPVATPGTTPVPPPATTNAPAVPGQSWCVAKGGIQETALQAALDYACGKGGADCSATQQGGSCFNPNTLQNHASYAFNSYFQKNPGPTSCDFGGTALVTNTNPSTGSCIYPASASSSLPSPVTGNSTPASPASPVTVNPTPPTLPTPVSPPSPVIVNPTPVSPTPPSSSGAGVPGAGTPPFVLNSSSPTSGDSLSSFPDSSSGFNSSTSKSWNLQPFISCIILVTSIITGKLF